MKFNLPVWKKAPFIRLLAPAIIGILLAYYLQIPETVYLIISIASLSGFIWIHFASTHTRLRYYYLTGILNSLFVAASFSIITLHHDVRMMKKWYGHQDSIRSVVLTLKEAPELKGKYYRAKAEVDFVYSKMNLVQTTGTILLYLSSDSIQSVPHQGDVVAVNKSPAQIRNTGNPGGFDYKAYLSKRNIFHSVYAYKNEWEFLKSKKIPFFEKQISSIRRYVIEAIDSCFPKGTPNEKSIAKALWVGYKGDLDKELQQAYSNAGVVHIIAISGLHLGLVYFILIGLVSRIPFVNKKGWLHALLCISGLWIFSFVSGASASVMRSAVMFTFILVGKALSYKGSISNALASSSFFLLLINPYFLWDAGFLLSYAAVVGIVSLQDPLYRLIYVKNKKLRYLWKAATVSISAQLTTVPICLYFFHQFPNYFLIANLIVVPLANVVLIIGFVFVVFSWVSPVAVIIAKGCSWLIEMMNLFVQFVSHMPGAVTSRVYFPLMAAWLSSLAVFFLIIAIRNRKFKPFNYAFLFLLITFFYAGIRLFEIRKHPALIIYNIAGNTAIHLVDHGKSMLIADSRVVKSEGTYDPVFMPAYTEFGITNNVESVVLDNNKQLIKFYDKELLYVDSLCNIPGNVVNCQILFIAHNPRIDLENAVKMANPEIVVFGSSNKLWKIEKWKSICERLALPCFSIPDEGAFVYYPRR